jgi:hypothetical protein
MLCIIAHGSPLGQPLWSLLLGAGLGHYHAVHPRSLRPPGRRCRQGPRIDWKYGLSLELDDPGFDASVRNLKHVARYVTVLASPRVSEEVLRKDG